MYVIYNVCCGLKDLKIMQDDHGKVTMQSIVAGRDVKITDPITEELGDFEGSTYRRSKINGYPSPAILFNRVDTGMNIDILKEDLFSVGLIALQMLSPEIDIKSIYKTKNKAYLNIKIDF